MLDAATAERAFALYRAAAPLTDGAGAQVALERALRANARLRAPPATSSIRVAKPPPPRAPALSREHREMAVGARAFMDALWSFERRTLSPHPLLSEEMRAVEPRA